MGKENVSGAIEKQKVSSAKKLWLEVIRIIAICLVIFNHTGENGFELFRYADSTGLRFIVIFLDLLCKAGVPLFFMISGVLLLGKEETIRDIFTKRVLRYVIIIVLFSLLYYVRLYLQHPEYGFSISYFIKYIYSNPFVTPFWFLYLYLAFLIMLPFLRAVVKTLNEEEYLLLIAVMIVMSYLEIPEFLFGFERINLSFGILETNILYPLIGFGIANSFSERLFEKKTGYLISVFVVINYICSVVMNCLEFDRTGEYSGHFIDQFSFIPAIALFYLVFTVYEKKKRSINENVKKVLCYMGSCTFCIYLFEEMLRGDVFLRIFEISSIQTVRLLLCIPYIIGIVVSGVIISSVLKKIPIVNKLNL